MFMWTQNSEKTTTTNCSFMSFLPTGKNKNEIQNENGIKMFLLKSTAQKNGIILWEKKKWNKMLITENCRKNSNTKVGEILMLKRKRVLHIRVFVTTQLFCLRIFMEYWGKKKAEWSCLMHYFMVDAVQLIHLHNFVHEIERLKLSKKFNEFLYFCIAFVSASTMKLKCPSLNCSHF